MTYDKKWIHSLDKAKRKRKMREPLTAEEETQRDEERAVGQALEDERAARQQRLLKAVNYLRNQDFKTGYDLAADWDNLTPQQRAAIMQRVIGSFKAMTIILRELAIDDDIDTFTGQGLSE